MINHLTASKPNRTFKGFILAAMAGMAGLKMVLKGALQALDGRLSDDVGDTLDKVPKSIRRQLMVILGARGLLHNNKLFTSRAKKLTDLTLSFLDKSDAEAKILPVPQILFDDIRWDTFYEQYLRDARPVVIKGFPFTAHEKWSLDWFIKHCGDSEVIFTDMDTGHNYVGSMSELKDTEKSLYVHNSEQLLLQNPQLLEDLNLASIESLFKWRFICAQVFLGSSTQTGTSFHCARVTNFFYMVKGRKRWTFVDPRNTLLLYPYLTPGNAYQDCLVSGVNDDEDFKHFPLYRRCPRFQVTLEPGDLLLNPSWWWHSIQNLTEETIGVSSRWSHISELNSLFSALMELTPGRHLDRRAVIEALLSKGWDTRGRIKSSKYNEGSFEPSMFESNSHSEEVAIAKKSGVARMSWF